ALRLGTADTEAILRRFTRNNVQHPTYKALAEIGKAIKTIFLYVIWNCCMNLTFGYDRSRLAV
ncbi:MAG: Tn3 family transposase, partial [Gammaproteobacteria bacterium]